MLLKSTNFKGYTLIEIIVVMAIIVFVVTTALYAISVARENSQATRIAANFKQMEKAFNLWMEDQKYNSWPDDGSFGVTDNPSIDILITSYGLGKFLASAPKINNISSIYDSDSEEIGASSCGVATYW